MSIVLNNRFHIFINFNIFIFMIFTRSLDKPIPHPILDDPSKMMRIIGKFIE
jgi:hypothetical protein